MFWKKKYEATKRLLNVELDRLKVEIENRDRKIDAYDKKIHELTDMISGPSGERRVGPWCDGCKHLRRVSENIVQQDPRTSRVYFDGETFGHYCAKHTKEFCQDYEEMECGQERCEQ